MKRVEPGAAVNDPPAAFGIEKVWDADGTMLAKLSDRPINLGVPDDTAPPPDPTAAADAAATRIRPGAASSPGAPTDKALPISSRKRPRPARPLRTTKWCPYPAENGSASP